MHPNDRGKRLAEKVGACDFEHTKDPTFKKQNIPIASQISPTIARNRNIEHSQVFEERPVVRCSRKERLPTTTRESSELDQLDDERQAQHCVSGLIEKEDEVFFEDEGYSQRKHGEQRTSKHRSGEKPGRARDQHVNGSILRLQNGNVHSKT